MSAGATSTSIRSKGPFHGAIAATTPTGSATSLLLLPGTMLACLLAVDLIDQAFVYIQELILAPV